MIPSCGVQLAKVYLVWIAYACLVKYVEEIRIHVIVNVANVINLRMIIAITAVVVIVREITFAMNAIAVIALETFVLIVGHVIARERSARTAVSVIVNAIAKCVIDTKEIIRALVTVQYVIHVTIPNTTPIVTNVIVVNPRTIITAAGMGASPTVINDVECRHADAFA